MRKFSTKFKNWDGQKLINYCTNYSLVGLSNKNLALLRLKFCELISYYDSFHFDKYKAFTNQIAQEVAKFEYLYLNKKIKNINFYKYLKLLRKDCSRMINKIDEVLKWA